MSEETDGAIAGAEGVDAPEAVETPSEATAEQTAATETADELDASEEAEKPKREPWFQKRINEVTAKVYEKDREAAYWRGIAEGRAPQAQTAAETLPTLEQFDYDEGKYQAALTKHITDKVESGLDGKLTERDVKNAELKKNDTAIQKLQEGGAKYSDFHAAVSGIQANQAIRDFLLDDPRAPDVLYDLGKDTAAAERFNKLNLVQQAIELGKRAATPKSNPRTIAPPPPQTVAGLVSGVGKTPDQMSMSEYAAWVKERDKN